MTTQESSALTPDIQALVGKEWVFTSPEEISRASIRKFALAIGDHNPLYLDAEYAGNSKYGSIIAPPTLICETWQYFTGGLDEIGTPSKRPTLHLGLEIRGENEYTFLQPMRPDDTVTARYRIADIREREARSGKLIFLVVEVTFSNHLGEIIAVNKETTIFRASGSEAEGGMRPGAGTNNPDPDFDEPERDVRRLETALHYEDVNEGDEIPELSKAINMPRMVFYSASTWDFHRYHYDYERVSKNGFPRPFVDGQMLGAYLAQMLADWTGDPGAIRGLGFRYRGFSFPGDVLTCKGKVKGKSTQDGQGLVECDLWVENQDGEQVLAPASAALSLPSRNV